MKTTIYQNEAGKPVLSIEGSESPESVALKYLAVQEMLKPAEPKTKAQIIKEVEDK